jgi:hypothetical protein
LSIALVIAAHTVAHAENYPITICQPLQHGHGYFTGAACKELFGAIRSFSSPGGQAPRSTATVRPFIRKLKGRQDELPGTQVSV